MTPWTWFDSNARHPPLSKEEITFRRCVAETDDRDSLRAKVHHAFAEPTCLTEDVLVEALLDRGELAHQVRRELLAWAPGWLEAVRGRTPPQLARASVILADRLLQLDHFISSGRRLQRALQLTSPQEAWALMCLARIERSVPDIDPSEREALHRWLLLPAGPDPLPPCPLEGAISRALADFSDALPAEGIDPDGSSRRKLDDAFLAFLGDLLDVEFRRRKEGLTHIRWIHNASFRRASPKARQRLQQERQHLGDKTDGWRMLPILAAAVSGTGDPRDEELAEQIATQHSEMRWTFPLLYQVPFASRGAQDITELHRRGIAAAKARIDSFRKRRPALKLVPMLLALALASCRDEAPRQPSPEPPSPPDTIDPHSLVLDSLQRHHWGEATETEHIILAERQFPTSRIVVSASNAVGNDCHACAPHVSVFELRKADGAWRMTGSDIAFATAGAWGTLPREQVRIEPLDSSKVAILLTSSFMGQGYLETSLEAHLWDSEFTYDMFTAQVGSSNAGAIVEEDSAQLVDWTADAELLPRGSGLPQLRVIRHGVQEGDSLRDTAWFDFDRPTKVKLTRGMDVMLPGDRESR